MHLGEDLLLAVLRRAAGSHHANILAKKSSAQLEHASVFAVHRSVGLRGIRGRAGSHSGQHHITSSAKIVGGGGSRSREIAGPQQHSTVHTTAQTGDDGGDGPPGSRRRSFAIMAADQQGVAVVGRRSRDGE